MASGRELGPTVIILWVLEFCVKNYERPDCIFSYKSAVSKKDSIIFDDTNNNFLWNDIFGKTNTVTILMFGAYKINAYIA